MIFDRQIIKNLVINIEMEVFIWFLIKKNQYICQRLKRLNKSNFQMNLNISL